MGKNNFKNYMTTNKLKRNYWIKFKKIKLINYDQKVKIKIIIKLKLKTKINMKYGSEKYF